MEQLGWFMLGLFIYYATYFYGYERDWHPLKILGVAMGLDLVIAGPLIWYFTLAK